MQSHALVSADLPLLSNLNMLENIGLIKEVHDNLSINKAENLALEMLKKIGLEDIALKRENSCSRVEILYVMLIRALMTQEKSVIIKLPSSILDDLQEINKVVDNISLLKASKNIFFVDLKINKIHYEGCQCNIIK